MEVRRFGVGSFVAGLGVGAEMEKGAFWRQDGNSTSYLVAEELS